MSAYRYFRDHAELDAQVMFGVLAPDAAGHVWLTTRSDGAGAVRIAVPCALLRRGGDVCQAAVGRVAHALGVPPATLRAYRGPLPIRHGRIEIFNGERWRAAA